MTGLVMLSQIIIVHKSISFIEWLVLDLDHIDTKHMYSLLIMKMMILVLVWLCMKYDLDLYLYRPFDLDKMTLTMKQVSEKVIIKAGFDIDLRSSDVYEFYLDSQLTLNLNHFDLVWGSWAHDLTYTLTYWSELFHWCLFD